VTNRALVAAALARGRSVLRGASFSDDSMLLVKALAELGFAVAIRETEREITVEGQGGDIPRARADLWLGNAGTSLRFLTSMLCVGRGEFHVDGGPRMRQRPIGDLVDGLAQLGARIEYSAVPGSPPLRIHAEGLKGGTVSIGGRVSSQFASAILLCAPAAGGPVRLVLRDGLVSAPYVQTTCSVMGAFGVDVARPEPATLEVKAGPYQPCVYPVVGDAASATYMFALAAATGGEITVEGLDASVPQAELAFLDVLAAMGCTIRWNGSAATVRGGPLVGVDVDMNAMPDSVQTLAALAVLAAGPTRIRNVGNLRLKETDRLAALERELRRFGAETEASPDGLRIDPPARPTSAAVDTYEDHRMAMSFAVLGAAVGDVVIRDPGVVTKSFPTFFDELRGLGVVVKPDA
jgi:3-phosphoshikimate 1-carboxyvinyltransferase